ncbi:unnamed protein product, partial [Nesidiocoris tenuis]
MKLHSKFSIWRSVRMLGTVMFLKKLHILLSPEHRGCERRRVERLIGTPTVEDIRVGSM